jgi:hypothetical protein
LKPFFYKIGREVFEAARARLVRRKGLFELLGLDFNSNPKPGACLDLI